MIHQLPEDSMEAEALKRVKVGELALPDPILKPSYKMRFDLFYRHIVKGKKTGRYVKNDSSHVSVQYTIQGVPA